MQLKPKEVAALTGVTVRTLHYYDQIDLLKPSDATESGYRLYDEQCLERLQQILFYRELDFPLEQIKAIIDDINFDKIQALIRHREMLVQKRDRLNGLIELAQKTIEGSGNMSFKEFDKTEINQMRNKYAQEVRERWGETDAYAQSQAKTGDLNDNQWGELGEAGNAILDKFAKISGISPESGAAQALVKEWQDYISNNFYDCSKQILACLGQMYVGDERFTQNIDRHGQGTAEFMAKAIEIYCR